MGSSIGRGVVRLDYPSRFVPDTYSLELRAGTKDADLAALEHTITQGSNKESKWSGDH